MKVILYQYLRKRKLLNSFGKFFAYLFFLFLPFQIRTFFLVPDVYQSGLSNPYLSHYLYLGDLFLVVALFFFSIDFIFNRRRAPKKKHLSKSSKLFFAAIFSFLIFSGISLFFTDYFLNSVFHFLRIIEFFFLFLLIVFSGLEERTLFIVLAVSIFLSSLLGIFQYFFQSSLGLGFLGEPLLSLDMKNVAKVSLPSGDFLRSYAVFPHPNLFALYLVFGIFLSLEFLKDYKKYFVFFLPILLFALLLTFSRSAFLAAIISLLLYFLLSSERKHLKYFILVLLAVLFFSFLTGLIFLLKDRILFGDPSGFSERLLYLDISKEMFFNNPLGVGLGNFTLEMQSFSGLKIAPWFYQPVHNSFLLILNEIGIFGFLSFFSIFIFGGIAVFKKSKLLFSVLLMIFIAANFDHYFITLYQGQALLWIVFALIGKKLIYSR